MNSVHAADPGLAKAAIAAGRRWVCSGLAVLAFASPALLRAQFQQPTDEELKMTSDPKAPGAAAVYLYHEEIADGPAHTRSIYERIKVLTERGKELATVNIPYEYGLDKVTDIEGRTIHADGTVVPLSDKPFDLTDVKTKGFQMNSVVFSLPDVEVGSILEFRLKFRRDDEWTFLPDWVIQRPYFIRKAHYSFTPDSSQSVMYSAHVDPNAKVVQSKKRVITLDLADLPPEPDDDWMPPMNTLRWRVEFFSNHKEFTTEEAFWNDAREYWANWIRNFTDPTGPIKKAVAQIVAPNDTDEQKAAKIYGAVQKLDNTDFSRKKSQAERKKEKLKDIVKAEDVWKQQSGSANDIALLFAAMARAAGLKVWPAYLVNRNRAMFDRTYLSDSQFDDDIVIVELDGKSIYLDPGQKMCPFGSLHWKHSLATGFRLTDKGAEIATTPALSYKASGVHRVADLTIDPSGAGQGTIRFVLTGQDALDWRQLAIENDRDEVKKQFNDSMKQYLPDGVQADFDHFLGLEDYATNLIGIVNVSGSLGTATGRRLFLPALFFQSKASHPFVAQDKREISIDVHYPKIEEDDVTYHFPPGFSLETVPQPASTAWPNHATFKIASEPSAHSVGVLRILAYNFTILDPKEYQDLRAFYQKIAAADQQQLVLTATPPAKGN